MAERDACKFTAPLNGDTDTAAKGGDLVAERLPAFITFVGASVHAVDTVSTIYLTDDMTSISNLSITTAYSPDFSVTSLVPDAVSKDSIQECNASLTGSYIQRWLKYKSDEKAYLYLPVIIYDLILILLGTLGNIIVIYIYKAKYKRQTSNYYIITLAIFDLLTSTVVIPIDIYDLRSHYSFFSETACKIFRYFENMSTYGSAIVLIEIAFDRYKKICHPLTPDTFQKTKILCITAGCLAVVLASPAVIIFGIAHRTIPEHNFCGFDCSVSGKYKRTRIPMIFYSVLILIFIVSFTTMLFLYIRIWLAIRSRRRNSIGESYRQSDSSQRQSINGGKNIVKQRPSKAISNGSSGDDSVFLHNEGKGGIQASISSRRVTFTSLSSASKKAAISKTTKIFVAVSIAYILSYLPGVIVMSIRSILNGIETRSSSAIQIFLKLFARSHFISSAINPVIYSVLNVNFRAQCIKTFQSMSRAMSARDDQRKGSFRMSRRQKISRSDSHKSDKTKEYEMEQLKAEMDDREHR
ncbi:hypothetical protein FSP39_008232 [Pinctada imbricata]|uniref:G-protein coupled receptors family 1 profile domain-containing protein n=1 Tax=Pinctada imbricata TaxID=66713 RepID=A0AA89BZ41_PINIB|nr:hypothetical protein FSP39_008232 [Pinctada imbricata]